MSYQITFSTTTQKKKNPPKKSYQTHWYIICLIRILVIMYFTHIVRLFPSVMAVGKALSIVVAATVMTHGAVFDIVCEIGPSFPAEQTTLIPLAVAWKEPIAIGSR